MAEYSTPKLPSTDLSSVFMTPSSSTGKPQYRKPKVLTPLPHLSFLSPAPSPDMLKKPALSAARDNSEYRDILSELFSRGIPCLVDDILSLLSPADLHNCLQVCHQWHDIISEKPRFIEQIRSYLKASTENTKKPYIPLISSGSRRALCAISNTLPPPQPLSQQPSMSKYKAVQTQKHRPCPMCGSPARQLNHRRTVCTNLSCQMDFCQKCFRSWHEGRCQEEGRLRSPKRSQVNTLIAGSQKSKKRLRRL